ncbi:MAG: ABC transporter permease subunit [Eubacteriales bacterium]|nr:ABC transporter permease subunit [Eubacteriales bacterium]MDD4105766.1 ABC transporter permease subunit [Eubacteriales bacterium]MDD4710272.1 ABC transporter permease subunit [Eubacteriales bacterium]
MADWLTRFPEELHLNIQAPIDNGINYMVENWGGFFDGLSNGLRAILRAVQDIIDFVPWWALVIIVFAATLLTTKKWPRAVLYSILLVSIGLIGLWDELYDTLALVITSVFISLAIGFPLGVLISFSDRANKIVRPILDTMQTMPSFVYLIPAVMLLGLGNVPAVIATTIYAMPPMVRMTSHGLRQVDTEVQEASLAFGATRLQMLGKVLVPQAVPTIMTGVNQTIIMAISMVVTCSMIGATGLGSEVIAGMNRLDSGRGFAAGIAIVILAIIMDRITQNMVKEAKSSDA